MISNQICLKPYIARLAANSNDSVSNFYDRAARELSTPQSEQFVPSEKQQAALAFTQSLRLKESDLKESYFRTDPTRRFRQSGRCGDARDGSGSDGHSSRNGRRTGPGAGYSGPGSSAAEPVFPQQRQRIPLQPGIQHLASQMETSVDGLMTRLAEGYAKPGATSDPKIQGNLLAASVFRPVPSEVSELEAQFQARGLSPEASAAVVSGLVLSTAAYEPKFREGLDQVTRIATFEREDKSNNWLEKAWS